MNTAFIAKSAREGDNSHLLLETILKKAQKSSSNYVNHKEIAK